MIGLIPAGSSPLPPTGGKNSFAPDQQIAVDLVTTALGNADVKQGFVPPTNVTATLIVDRLRPYPFDVRARVLDLFDTHVRAWSTPSIYKTALLKGAAIARKELIPIVLASPGPGL